MHVSAFDHVCTPVLLPHCTPRQRALYPNFQIRMFTCESVHIVVQHACAHRVIHLYTRVFNQV